MQTFLVVIRILFLSSSVDENCSETEEEFMRIGAGAGRREREREIRGKREIPGLSWGKGSGMASSDDSQSSSTSSSGDCSVCVGGEQLRQLHIKAHKNGSILPASVL